MSEKEFKNIENNNILEKSKDLKQDNIPKSVVLSKFKNYELFSKTISKLDEKIKNKLFEILNSIPEDELTMYLEMDCDNSNFITEDDINRFIKEKNNYSPKVIIGVDSIKKVEDIKDKGLSKDISQNIKGAEKNKELNKNQFSDLEKKLPSLISIFKDNSDITNVLNNLENCYLKKKKLDENINNENHQDETEKIQNNIKKLLNDYFNNKENSFKFFKTLNEKNPELYKETYSAVIAISPELEIKFSAWGIPKESYKPTPLEISDTIKNKEILAQFPNVKPGEIEKRGEFVSYGDKTIDTKSGKAYISGENGYSLETKTSAPNSLDLRVKYQSERLEILENIKTNEKIIDTINKKQELKKEIEKLKSQKSSDGKNANDLELDIKITELKKEIEVIDERLKAIIPGYKEEQDENLKIFLEEKIKESKEQLISLKEKFDQEMLKLLEKGKDEIISRDQKIRETIKFLDTLGITNINQNDLQKIINRININPGKYNFSKQIDLKSGFEGTPTDALLQKKEFFRFFSKIYEKMGFIPPVNENIVDGFNKDERLVNNTKFKQKLEDIGVTNGGELKIETFFKMIEEKKEEKEEKTK